MACNKESMAYIKKSMTCIKEIMAYVKGIMPCIKRIRREHVNAAIDFFYAVLDNKRILK
jgi:hypothetical protein